MEIAAEYLELAGERSLWAPIAEEHARTVATVLEVVEAHELLDRHPVLQRSVRLRNPYVDPMNAIQVALLRRCRGGDEDAVPPLLRSIAGIAAALRNTGRAALPRRRRRLQPGCRRRAGKSRCSNLVAVGNRCPDTLATTTTSRNVIGEVVSLRETLAALRRSAA